MIEFIRNVYWYCVFKCRRMRFDITLKLRKHGIVNRADLFFAADRMFDAAEKLQTEKGLK